MVAGNRQLLGFTGTGAHEDSIETLGEEIVDSEIASDCHIAMDTDAKLADFLDFVAHHILGKTVFRNTEHEYTASLRFHLENLNVETLAGKLTRNSQTGRTATNDGHTSTGLGDKILAREIHRAVKVSHETFELTDVDMRALLVEDTMALTLALVGTDASADSRKIALCVYYSHRIAEITHRQLADPIRHVVADRATLLAKRVLTVEAAFRLLNSLKHGVAIRG